MILYLTAKSLALTFRCQLAQTYKPTGTNAQPVRTTAQGYVGVDSIRQKFTGYERDTETDLDFAQARMLNFSIGRFSSPDNFLNDTHRIIPQSWNLYLYVGNNPLNAIDPSGEILFWAGLFGKDGKRSNDVETETKNKQTLLGWLNHVYGCESCVTFNENNELQLDASKVSKEVLEKAKDLTDAINNKDHVAAIYGVEGRSDVNFAKAMQADDIKKGAKFDSIIIDFKDFRGLSGDKAAVSSFANYAFVHEVFHLFPSLLKDDVSSKDVTGPVENKVNEIRQVRGDLLRASYSAESDNNIFGRMYFGPAKVDKKTGQIKRNVNGGIIVESKKIVTWNLRMTGN